MQLDIDHPAVDAGVEALFGHHPERGGQERRQAAFVVIQAAIPFLAADPVSEFEDRLIEAEQEIRNLRGRLVELSRCTCPIGFGAERNPRCPKHGINP